MPRSDAMMNAAAIAGFVVASLTRRTAIGFIGDSNSAQISFTGHNDGMRRAASFMLGCYGSGLFPGYAGGEYNAGLLDASCTGINGLTGAPAAVSNLSFAATFGGPEGADYISAWPANSTSGAVVISSAHPMHVWGKLEFHSRIWRPAASYATFLDPSIFRADGGVGTLLHPSASTPIALGAPPADGITNFKWTLPAGTLADMSNPATPLGNGSGFSFREQRWSGTNFDGALAVLYRQVIDAEKFTGIQWSKFMTNGGQPCRYPATVLCNSATDLQIAEYFRAHAVTQVDAAGKQLPPIMLIHICHGGNDAGDVTSSITYRRGAGFGGAVTTGLPLGNTKQGTKNNFNAIINRLRDVWVTTCGYDERNLYFLLGAYQPQPNTVSQFTYTRTIASAAWLELTQEQANVAAIDGYKIDTHTTFSYAHPYTTTTTPFIAAASVPWYRDPVNDIAHMNQPGYHHWGNTIWGMIVQSVFGGLVDGSTLTGTIRDSRGRTLLQRN